MPFRVWPLFPHTIGHCLAALVGIGESLGQPPPMIRGELSRPGCVVELLMTAGPVQVAFSLPFDNAPLLSDPSALAVLM